MSAETRLLKMIVEAPEGEPRAMLLQNGARALLRDPAVVETVVIRVAEQDDSGEWEAAAALLASALDEARMARENGAPEGAVLIDAIGTALAALETAATFAPTLRLRLAQI